LDEAALRAKRLAPLATTLAWWPDAGAPPADVHAGYVACLERLVEMVPGAYLPLKTPALDVASRDDVLRRARSASRLVMLDATGPEHVEATLGVASPHVGVTLPGRWRRSLGDLETALRKDARLRILEGALPDPDGGELHAKSGLLALTRAVAGRAPFVSIATHDARLALEATAILRGAGTDTELELVQGLPRRRLLGLARQRGVPVRITIPYGAAWVRYASERLLRDPWRLFRS
jgi:proline dehydrogenase